ncbi:MULTISPECIES: Hsp20/alpha crystallin family protein [Bacillaceae]|uniref:Hsp20/alpha crystallin family protein n=1 Tax=Evansella alkalicola TaxID=745819 RepID=A0ABS6JPW2_9BACI|nr:MULTISPECIES: Hsp20/alpha crystallin family protein [Bacillaceae]MBU9720528.1 Hsp20/alpha crystallin family protein [Bacillus alkalicola]
MSKEKDRSRSLQPFHEKPFGELLQSLDSFFQDAFKQLNLQGMKMIPIYQYETNNEYVIEAELPGVKKDQIFLDIYHNFIKIAVQSDEIVEEINDNIKSIKKHGKFQRSERVVQLPFHVDENEVNASLKDGILKIRIPNKRMRIAIE